VIAHDRVTAVIWKQRQNLFS